MIWQLVGQFINTKKIIRSKGEGNSVNDNYVLTLLTMTVFTVINYHKPWLLGACVYNFQRKHFDFLLYLLSACA